MTIDQLLAIVLVVMFVVFFLIASAGMLVLIGYFCIRITVWLYSKGKTH